MATAFRQVQVASGLTDDNTAEVATIWKVLGGWQQRLVA